MIEYGTTKTYTDHGHFDNMTKSLIGFDIYLLTFTIWYHLRFLIG